MKDDDFRKAIEQIMNEIRHDRFWISEAALRGAAQGRLETKLKEAARARVAEQKEEPAEIAVGVSTQNTHSTKATAGVLPFTGRATVGAAAGMDRPAAKTEEGQDLAKDSVPPPLEAEAADKRTLALYRLLGETKERFQARRDASNVERRVNPQPDPDPIPELPVSIVEDGASTQTDEWSHEAVKEAVWPPGIVGEIAEYVYASAMYPSRKFAIATALGVVGTLISNRIAGPSGPRGTGTHLYQALIGRTGSGKEHVRTAGKLLLDSVGDGDKLIGPGRFKSGPGIVTWLKDHPVSLCFIDEIGAMFASLADPKCPAYVREINETLRELWGLSFGRYDSAAGARDKSETIIHPALSLIGMTTPQELYRACKSRDVANGFLNRFLFVEEPEMPPYQKVRENSLVVSRDLSRALNRLHHRSQAEVLDDTEWPHRLTWGTGAEEVYNTVRIERENEVDELRQELCVRTAEKIVRVATIVAAGKFMNLVTQADMEWARDCIITSDDTLYTGIQEYMIEEKKDFSELCREIIRRIRKKGGALTGSEIKRSFQNNVRYKREIDDALDHMLASLQLEYTRKDTGGRPSGIYSIYDETQQRREEGYGDDE
jgi:Protein of unknown function (DUF3987)